ncbi:MAG: polymerase family protein [Chitinophagaceae bacterium]|nr:polymerase family protein [Chitinophagaceae bacterium]
MGKRYVSIWFPQLATDCFSLRNTGLRKIPFVLRSPVHGRMIITAANAPAQQSGIYPGMALADARVIEPSLQVMDDRPGLNEKILQRIAAWCIRFTPVAAVDPPDGLLLDATGCAHLWRGDANYLKDIIRKIHAKGFSSRAAMADTIGAAWAVARSVKGSVVIPPGKHIDALVSLPPEMLRLDATIVERLHKLGLTRIQNLVAMPRAALRRRFGPQLIERLNHAFGTAEEFIQPVYPPRSYEERLPCLEPILRIEGVTIALDRLLEALCKKLNQEGKGIRSALFTGHRTDGRTVQVDITTLSPSLNFKHLVHLFELKFPTFEPGPGIELFLLEATKVETYLPVQQEAWKESTAFNRTALSELADRLAGKLGSQAISRYLPDEHYWPERSFKKAASLHEQSTTTWRLDQPRPIELLPSPERIEVTAPIPDYPPMMFRYKGKLHKIIKADGPERIEQEWWIQEGRHRDYYTVEDEAGARYWLFRSGHYDAEKTYDWFIHGFFA